jgi:SAM-dependent methyltransferase
MADFPLVPDAADLLARLAASLDVEDKIPRALETLGPVAGRDVVLIDGAGGLRARQLAGLGARLTVLVGSEAEAGPLGELGTDVSVAVGTSAALGLPDASADVIVACWSAFRGPSQTEVAEADRVLRPDGRLLVVHDYGRDDVSRLRGDLPEYGSWGRRDGWFLKNGFKMRVIHCFWTFDSMDEATAFLGDVFGETGAAVAATLKRPRLSYNVAVYHRPRGGAPAAVTATAPATATA